MNKSGQPLKPSFFSSKFLHKRTTEEERAKAKQCDAMTLVNAHRVGQKDVAKLAQLALASVSHIRHLSATMTNPDLRPALEAHCVRVVKAAQEVKQAFGGVRGENDENWLPFHCDPPIGAPRPDLQTHLDPEIREETHKDDWD